MNACQPRDPKEVVQDILAIEEAITLMLGEAKGTSVAGIFDVFKREDAMRLEIKALQDLLPEKQYGILGMCPNEALKIDRPSSQV